MKKIFTDIFAFVLNIGLYFFLSIIDVFAEFLLFAEGQGSQKYSFWGSLFFVLLQILILFFLYKKKVFIQDKTLLILNVLITVCLFLYFGVYLSNT